MEKTVQVNSIFFRALSLPHPPTIFFLRRGLPPTHVPAQQGGYPSPLWDRNTPSGGSHHPAKSDRPKPQATTKTSTRTTGFGPESRTPPGRAEGQERGGYLPPMQCPNRGPTPRPCDGLTGGIPPHRVTSRTAGHLQYRIPIITSGPSARS